MKYRLNYGSRVVSVPRDAVDAMARASEIDLKVLLYLCSHENKADEKKLAKLLSCDEGDIKASLSFWRGAGIVELCGDGESEDGEGEVEREEKRKHHEDKKEQEKPNKKLRLVEELPKYTSDELAAALEARSDSMALIDECQNIVGKIFNMKEASVLVGLVDYLGLEPDYIMMLLNYCVSMDKRSLHYLEKMAFSFYDAGIVTGEQLAEELRRRESAQEAEGRIRTMFGVGERALTTKERKFISAWINDLSYSMEIIEKAYEITADATGKGSFAYANSILERWNASGLRTLEEINASYEKGEQPREGSFDTDTFFDAAVIRSFREAEK